MKLKNTYNKNVALFLDIIFMNISEPLSVNESHLETYSNLLKTKIRGCLDLLILDALPSLQT